MVDCLIPVHNRLEETKRVLECLEAQSAKDLHIIVIDDGSTDGTAEYLRLQAQSVEVIEGNGSQCWGGAMAMGIEKVLAKAKDGGYVLFLNNDARFKKDFVSSLVAISRKYGNAVVGSLLMDLDRPDRVLSIGPRICYARARIQELYSQPETPSGQAGLPEVIEVDALPGRGTLYPIEVLRRIGGLRQQWLPHYLCDYEISARAKRAGFKTLVATHSRVWTRAEDSGLNPSKASLLQRLFNRRSRSNVVDAIAFFTLSGPWYYRITGPVRVVLFRAWAMGRRYLYSDWARGSNQKNSEHKV